MALSIVNIRTEIAAAVAAGSSNAGGVRIDVETRLAPGNVDQASSNFRESARAALPVVFRQLFGTRDVRVDEQLGEHTDRLALATMADGSIIIVGRVKP